jgi:ATPase subunit of ABC transporter with duplicated ATPase domains
MYGLAEKAKPRTSGDTPKATGQSGGRGSRSKATAASSETGVKRKFKEEQDEEEGSVASSSSRKRVKVSTEATLSRSEAAAILGEMVMEMETIDHSMSRMREILSGFAGQANGKKRVTINGPKDDA